MKNKFSIGDKSLHKNGDLFIIAEIGLAHEGSLGMAQSMIEAAAKAGVDAVKFQTHLADQESTQRETFRVPVFPQDATRSDYWLRTAFDLPQWIQLAKVARENGLVFMSSPFSNKAVDWLQQCDVPAWKIASGELTNYPMIEAICRTGKPILVSSGMSSWQELDETLQLIESNGCPHGVFQCTSAYPCPPEKWGLNVIDQMRERYDCPIGLSDHSGTTTPSLAAITKGATLLEVHLALSKQQFGPDTKASLTPDQLTELVEAARSLTTSLSHTVDKDRVADQSQTMRQLFTKSVVATRPLSKGHVLTIDDLAFKKPGDGISAKDYRTLVGRRLGKNVSTDHFFSDEDLLN